MFARLDGQALRVVGLLVAAVVVGVLVGRPLPTPSTPVSVAAVPSVDESLTDLAVVHVSGQVVSPGLVEVPVDARVVDVIAAAGGVTARADLAGVNLAQPVMDGQQIVIPSAGSQNTGAAPTAIAGADSRVRINDADAALLETLPGVGPVLAEAILDHRAEYGSFRSVEDLLDVPGIGEQKLASLRERVVVP